ncbi:multidrug effflux MFS transporter [Pontibacter sp. BT310]|uniref:Multidrug effflux MFS transporter n=1 Tax=Pontibacter populi TaxID=890055 RepID=A0ABS6XCU6_9BACT|nr:MULTISPECIES: multidrug effflux MFS transporter [Pontibacter]MBJ6118842.1 multidrug effflux MFS transporter [Pontibacter sp. BT310]MBR0571270.1 multidrug effflux MFS transporter [Microvirga sp. STS03]MBW3365696.1 multidrug effflux MFS transporter [Pontibacter populi]
MTKKQYRTIILVLGALAAVGPFAIDMYLPGFPAIAKDLKTDIAHVGLSLTSYFIGIAVGQLIYGPLIDRFGRKKPLIIGLSIFVLASLGCALAPSVEWLIGLRLLLALGGCVGMVASRAMVRDLFPLKDIPNVFSTLMLVMGVAPIIAPTIGGYVTAHLGWQYIFVVLATIAAAVLFAVARLLPESRGADASISLKPRFILRDFSLVFRERTFLTYAVSGSLAAAGMFAYISGSPYVFMEHFGLTDTQYGIAFAMNAAGYILGSQVNRLLLRRSTSKQLTLKIGFIQFVAAIALVFGSVTGSLSALGTLALLFIFMFSLGIINPNASALAMSPFTKNAGSASAILGSLQMGTGALASALVSYLHNRTMVPMTGVMATLATLSLVFLLTARRSARKAVATQLYDV